MAEATARRRRADGERSRRAILHAAAELATVEGLDGLSIGRLAQHVGMSKSGLYAHFGSKEELQLATVATADAIFRDEVVEPGLAAPPGRERVLALCEAFLSHVERSVFPGGCFFAAAAAEIDTRPGAVRERVRAVHRDWTALIERLVREAQEAGEIDPSEDPTQLTFELGAVLLAANANFVLHGDRAVFDRARAAVRARLAA
jgi:AcrR family transcriptional regulator